MPILLMLAATAFLAVVCYVWFWFEVFLLTVFSEFMGWPVIEPVIYAAAVIGIALTVIGKAVRS